MYVYFTSILVFSMMFIGPFMPGITVDNYGRMVVDREKAKAGITKVIPCRKAENADRCKTALSQIDEMAAAVDEYNASFAKNGKDVAALYMKYDSKPEDFQKVYNLMDAQRDKGQKKLMDARFKMKDAMTAEEWGKLFNMGK